MASSEALSLAGKLPSDSTLNRRYPEILPRCAVPGGRKFEPHSSGFAMSLTHLDVQVAPRSFSSWWRGHPFAAQQEAYELFVDQAEFSSYFESEPHYRPTGALTIPYGNEDLIQYLEAPEKLRQALSTREKHDVINWAGIAAMLGDPSSFPNHKLPVLTCCGDELCGYMACSVSYDVGSIAESDTVTWHSFGLIHPRWPDPQDTWLLGEKWDFAPTERSYTFTFRVDDYMNALKELLQLDIASRASGKPTWVNRIASALKNWKTRIRGE